MTGHVPPYLVCTAEGEGSAQVHQEGLSQLVVSTDGRVVRSPMAKDLDTCKRLVYSGP